MHPYFSGVFPRSSNIAINMFMLWRDASLVHHGGDVSLSKYCFVYGLLQETFFFSKHLNSLLHTLCEAIGWYIGFTRTTLGAKHRCSFFYNMNITCRQFPRLWAEFRKLDWWWHLAFWKPKFLFWLMEGKKMLEFFRNVILADSKSSFSTGLA